eukprot:SAG31_NODE_4210_length_3469_cov_11.547774_4_plen_89_part_00
MQHQYLKGAKFAKKYPDIPVIINHLGTPTLDDLKDGGEIYWNGMKQLAEAGDHVYIKISMLCCASAPQPCSLCFVLALTGNSASSFWH